MIIRYIYLYIYNSEIDWQKRTWEHTRCLDICTNKVRIRVLNTETDSSEFKNNSESIFLRDLLLDEIRLKDPNNLSISLFDHSDKDQETIAQVIAELFDEKSVEEVLNDNEDTLN